MQDWYAGHEGAQSGPFTLGELREHVRSGRFGPHDLAWNPKLAGWTPIRDLPELAPPQPPSLEAPPPRADVPSGRAAVPPPPERPFEDGELLERPTPVTLLAAFQLVTGALLVAGAAILLLAGGSVGEREAWIALAVIAGIMAVAGGVKMIAGFGLLHLHQAGRILAIGLAVLSLVAFPFGTLNGVLVLIFLLHPAVRLLFSRPDPRSLDPQSREVLTRFRRSGAFTALMTVLLAFNLVAALPMTGCVTAIAVPNMLNAIQRGKQKRTMGDMRALGTALEAYSIDHLAYPVAPETHQLARALEPTYITHVPAVDAWGNALLYDASEDGTAYTLRSWGKDSANGGPAGDDPSGPTTNFADDIIFRNGTFVSWPEGIQE